MKLADLISSLNQIAPLQYAEAWDNVGLLAGDPRQDVTRAMLCIDYTAVVADESRDLNCDCIVAYHPPWFSAVKRITADGPMSLIHDAIRRGVAIYSPHTALDVAEGGTNDMLADAVGLTTRRPLRLSPVKPGELKLVTFVPENSVAAVSEALFTTGAGRIGNYSQCSFRSPGAGTFLGGAGSQPTLGEARRLETVAEIRLETVVPIARVSEVITALRKSHPYEEPAFDLITLAPVPSTMGQGRVGSLSESASVGELVDRLKASLEISSILVTGEMDRTATTIAMCAGAGGEFVDDAIAAGAEVFLTGELRHHDAIKLARAGVAAICTLHSNSERPVLRRLKARLEALVAEPIRPVFLVSQTDRDPFSIV
jgi:dinuclear metal center YbgI/SA1388 family protein